MLKQECNCCCCAIRALGPHVQNMSDSAGLQWQCLTIDVENLSCGKAIYMRLPATDTKLLSPAEISSA
jgi:hypothetical protein